MPTEGWQATIGVCASNALYASDMGYFFAPNGSATRNDEIPYVAKATGASNPTALGVLPSQFNLSSCPGEFVRLVYMGEAIVRASNGLSTGDWFTVHTNGAVVAASGASSRYGRYLGPTFTSGSKLGTGLILPPHFDTDAGDGIAS
jgi:hypothetical protein